MQSISTALTTGFGTAATDMLTVIGDMVPVVLPVAAAIAVITVAYRVFKRFTGR